MVVPTEKVVGNWFEADRICSVSYKVYAAKPSNDDTILAQMVEAAMRYDDPGCLVSTSGRELWVFSLDGDIPVPPSQFKMTVVSSGILQPEYFAIEEHSPHPWPLLTAVEGRCIAYLAQTSPGLHPFGKTSLISVNDGAIIHVKAAITCSGELNLRLTTERANLLPIQGKDCKAVWLVPSGRQAALVDASSVPSPLMARNFLSVVQKVVHFTIDATELDESPWVRVAMDGRDFLWPAALVMAIGGGTGGSALAWMAKSDELMTLGDNMLAMREALNTARTTAPPTAEPAPEDAFPPATRQFLHHSVLRVRKSLAPTVSVPPPPPTPSATTADSQTAPVSIAAAARAAASSVPAASIQTVSSAPTVLSVPSDGPEPIYPTPGDVSPVREWSPASEGWEEEDITVADFNFYDAPLEETVEVVKEPSVAPEASILDIPTEEIPEIEDIMDPEDNRSLFSALRFPHNTVDAKYTEGGRYFTFVKEEDEDDSSGKHDLRLVPDHKITGNDEDYEHDGDDDDEDDEEVEEDEEFDEGYEDTGNEDEEMFDVDDADNGDARAHLRSLYRKEQNESTEAVESWILALTSQAGLISADNASLDDLQFLMAQVVFDGNALRSLFGLAPNTGALEPISEAERTRLREIYPRLRAITLAEACSWAPPPVPETVETPEGNNTPGAWMGRSMSRSSAPSRAGSQAPGPSLQVNNLPSSRPPSRTPSRANSRAPSRAHSPDGNRGAAVTPMGPPALTSGSMETKPEAFALLSPPLYSVTRGDQPHKARAAILRFWRTFGLQPNPEPRDVRFILLTLASPRVVNQARLALRGLKETYQACHLGKLDLPSFGSVVNGVLNISADLEYTSPDTIGDLFETSCSYLKRQLQELDSEAKVIIAMAFPPGPRTSPLPLARGFRAIRASYPQIRWVLASIDSFVSKEGGDAPTSQYRSMKYALLVYDRWVPHTTIPYGGPQYPPAFSLARLAPHSISIKFQPRPPAQILDDDPMMHVAYAITADKRWVAVAWSDQWAHITKVEVLRLAGLLRTRASSPVLGGLVNGESMNPMAGPTGEPQIDRTLRNLDSVFSDIWRRTAQLCASVRDSPRNARWTVSIVKCGLMDAAEVGIWRRVADVRWEQHVQLAFPYLLHLPQPRPLNVPEGEVLFPHVSMTADSKAGARTPPSVNSESRNDNVIVAALDETQGIAFKNQPQTWGVSAPPLVTGVLIKPLVPAAFRGHQQLEVVLVYAQNQHPTSIMKQVLGQYRRLASLAEYNGVSSSMTIMPWHVHGANKMVAALSTL